MWQTSCLALIILAGIDHNTGEPRAGEPRACATRVMGGRRAVADALLGTELGDGQLGKETVHAADGAQVPAPEASLECPGAHHRARRDDQQQPCGQIRGVRQIPHLLPHQDGCEEREQEPWAPSLTCTYISYI